LLIGNDKKTTCIWRNCDFYHARAVGILGTQGEVINCGHTHKNGIGYLKSNTIGYERYTALYNTPQEHGGCKGCRFFIVCKGWCPASGLGHDWRNRTMHCEMWKKMLTYAEEKLLTKGKTPVSKSPERSALERNLLASWEKTERDVRYAWRDHHAHQIWEDRIRRISAAWNQIEIESVISGLRKCALIRIPAHDFSDLKKRLERSNIAASEISSVPSSYWRKAQKLELYVAVYSGGTKENFITACKQNDHKEIGRLLGYPSCCRDFYHQACVKEKKSDTVWPVALNTTNEETENALEIFGSLNTNFLLHKMNLKAIPHLPCSFNCGKSGENSEQFIRLGRENDYAEEMDWLHEILSMKMEWSALHGIAEIKTPLFKMITGVDTTTEKRMVRLKF